MNETLDLPEWDDLDWDNVMKKALTAVSPPAPSTPKTSPNNAIPATVQTTAESDYEWLKRTTRGFRTYGDSRREYNESEVLSSELEQTYRSKPPRSQTHNRTGPNRRSKEYEQENITSKNTFIPQSPSVTSYSPQVKENYHPENSFPQENVTKTLVLEFRSLFLSSSEQLRSISKFLSLVKGSITQEADFNIKDINQLITATFSKEKVKFHIPFRKLHQRYPLLIPMEEILLFDESYETLSNSITDSIQQIGKTFDMKKHHYLQQLRKLKEASNTAIRNAIQNERAETINSFQQLKLKYEQHIQTERTKFEEDRKHLQQEKQVIEEDYLRVKMHLEEMIEKDKITSLRLQDAVKHALKEQKHEHQEEVKRMRETLLQDMQRVKDDCQRQLDVVKQTQESALIEMRKSEREKRELVEQGKTHLEEECNILRKENAQFSSQLSSLREQYTRSMQEMREKHTRDLQERSANDIQSQAMIKNELASTLQRVQKEELRRKQDLEEQFDKMRQQLTTSHALDMEKLQDRHRSEMKRIQAELEAQHQEGIYKLKHIHEQELNRQIRENDRLQRLLARQGVATAVIAESGNFNLRPNSTANVPSYPSSPPRREKPVYHSLTPKGKSSSGGEDVSGKNRNKEEATANEKTTNKTLSNHIKDTATTTIPPPAIASKDRKLNWGFLESSLKSQDEKRPPKFSSDNLPPDPFILNEAMEGTKSNKISLGGHSTVGISTNANRVTSYLTQLEDYLQGKEVRVEEEEKQITDPRERKNYILSSIQDDDDDNDSDSLGAQGMNLAQLAQLPLEISGNSEWNSNSGGDRNTSNESDLLFPFNQNSSMNSSSLQDKSFL